MFSEYIFVCVSKISWLLSVFTITFNKRWLETYALLFCLLIIVPFFSTLKIWDTSKGDEKLVFEDLSSDWARKREGENFRFLCYIISHHHNTLSLSIIFITYIHSSFSNPSCTNGEGGMYFYMQIQIQREDPYETSCMINIIWIFMLV